MCTKNKLNIVIYIVDNYSGKGQSEENKTEVSITEAMVLNKAASNRDEKEGGEACELPKSEVVSNGYAVGHNAAEVEGSPGESEFLRTYKRRKAQKSASDGQGSEKKMASLEADEVCNLL